jgi:hypothetical protein
MLSRDPGNLTDRRLEQPLNVHSAISSRQALGLKDSVSNKQQPSKAKEPIDLTPAGIMSCAMAVRANALFPIAPSDDFLSNTSDRKEEHP